MSKVVVNEVYVIEAINEYVSCGWCFVVVNAMKRAYYFSLRMFGMPGGHSTMRKSLFGFYTPKLG